MSEEIEVFNIDETTLRIMLKTNASGTKVIEFDLIEKPAVLFSLECITSKVFKAGYDAGFEDGRKEPNE